MPFSSFNNTPEPVARVRPIFVEGPDGAGKSTLVAKLSEDLGLPVFHTGGPPVDRADLQARLDQIRAERFDHIFDRTPHISQCVYETLNDSGRLMHPGELFKELVALNPLVIYCRLASAEAMLGFISNKAKAHKTPEYVQRVKDRQQIVLDEYQRTIDRIKSKVLVLTYNWQLEPYAHLLENVKCAAWSWPRPITPAKSKMLSKLWDTEESQDELA